MKVCLFASIALFSCFAAGCERFVQIREPLEPLEPQVPNVGHGWLMFDLQTGEQHGKAQRYEATYEAEGKTARFAIELTAADPSGDPPISFSSGKLIAVPGSDASVLLRNLKTTLEAKNLPVGVKRVSELPFTAVILGTHDSHSADGGFFAQPGGNWTVMKIFIGKKDAPADVFLNFNPVLHKREFSIKDPEYGDDVLRELAKVL